MSLFHHHTHHHSGRGHGYHGHLRSSTGQAAAPTPDLAEILQKGVPLAKDLMGRFGLTKEGACGLVAFLCHESHLTPGIDSLIHDGGKGYGQWTGARRKCLEDFCREKNLSVNSDEGNRQYLFAEIGGLIPKIGDFFKQNGLIAGLQNAHTLEQGVNVSYDKYGLAGVPAMGDRLKYANLLYAEFDSHPSATNTASTGSPVNGHLRNSPRQ